MGAAEQEALIRAYASSSAAIRSRTLDFLIALFRSLGSWRDADISRFTARAVPTVAGAQRQTGSLTQAYLRAMIADQTGRPRSRAAAAVRTGSDLRPVDPATEYGRPFRTLWAELAPDAEGQRAEFDQAFGRALDRLKDLVVTDLQLAKTHASRAELEGAEGIGGYRRVLTGSQSCGLCIVACTQRYHKADLLPIHPGCDCAVAPIAGDHDPGQVLDLPLLEGVHDVIAQRFGVSDRSGRNPIDYRDVLITHEHGELGPLLAVVGQRFTGPDDLSAAS